MPKDKSHIEHAKTFQQIAGKPSSSVQILVKSGTGCADCHTELRMGDIAVRDPDDSKIVCSRCYRKRTDARRAHPNRVEKKD